MTKEHEFSLSCVIKDLVGVPTPVADSFAAFGAQLQRLHELGELSYLCTDADVLKLTVKVKRRREGITTETVEEIILPSIGEVFMHNLTEPEYKNVVSLAQKFFIKE